MFPDPDWERWPGNKILRALGNQLNRCSDYSFLLKKIIA